MKGTIRVRENRDGSKSYVCQVKLGRDPGTGKARVLTGTAKSERAAHRLVHQLIANASTYRAIGAIVMPQVAVKPRELRTALERALPALTWRELPDEVEIGAIDHLDIGAEPRPE